MTHSYDTGHWSKLIKHELKGGLILLNSREHKKLYNYKMKCKKENKNSAESGIPKVIS